MASLTTKFAVANHDNIQSLIEQNLLSYPTYVFCRDTNTMVFIDKNNQMQDIKGFNQSSIITVEELPTEGILSNTLYICNGVVSGTHRLSLKSFKLKRYRHLTA